MATQPFASDQFRFLLTATSAASPSQKYTAEDGTGQHCSICASVAQYDEVGKQLNIWLPPSLPVPGQLEVMVVDATDDVPRHYAPSEDAVRALVFTRRARWVLPPDAPPPKKVIVSYGFKKDDGEQVSKDHSAGPVDDTIPAASV